MMPYLEEIKKWNVFHNGTIEAFIVFKEEKVGEGSIYELWVFSAEFNQLKSLFSAVSASPDSCGVFAFPGRTRVSLHRHHIQTYSGRQKVQHIFPPNHHITKVVGKELTKGEKKPRLWVICDPSLTGPWFPEQSQSGRRWASQYPWNLWSHTRKRSDECVDWISFLPKANLPN